MTETTAPSTRRGSGLSGMLLPELKQMASSLGISGVSGMRKGDLVAAIAARQSGTSAPSSTDSKSTDSKSPDAKGTEASDRPARTPRRASRPAGSATQDSSSQDSTQARAGTKAPGDAPGESTPAAVVPTDNDSGSRTRSDTNRGDSSESRVNDQSRRNSGARTGDRSQDRNQDRSQDRSQDRDDDGDPNSRRRRRRGRDRYRDRRDRRPNAGMPEVDVEVTADDVLVPVAGILDVMDSYAFVRTGGYLPSPNDVYVSLSMVKRQGLRKGDAITGAVRQLREGERREKFNPLVRIDTVNGTDPDSAKQRADFSKLTPLYPQERLRLETSNTNLVTRVIDLVAPIGKGQRGLIVSPPKAGKTMVLQAIANAISENNPECHLMVVLVDERPEEVTDMQRSVKGEVIASTFDRPAEDHTIIAELAIERAKRLVELGHDVVVLLDSMTRLGRAYNLAAPASGRILSGGVDSTALYPPKRFFGAARNIENGGSLTILATALVETGSRMDEVIFEEFKGTGNMELKLDRRLADKRVFPAVDVDASGTRKEELLLGAEELKIVWNLRRVLHALDQQQSIELLLNKLRETKSNYEFLTQVQKTTPAVAGSSNED